MYSKVYLVDVGQRNALLSQTTLTMTSLFDLEVVDNGAMVDLCIVYTICLFVD
jgi:hypothetical protein